MKRRTIPFFEGILVLMFDFTRLDTFWHGCAYVDMHRNIPFPSWPSKVCVLISCCPRDVSVERLIADHSSKGFTFSQQAGIATTRFDLASIEEKDDIGIFDRSHPVRDS